jgi:hypothetical protein
MSSYALLSDYFVITYKLVENTESEENSPIDANGSIRIALQVLLLGQIIVFVTESRYFCLVFLSLTV